MHFAFFPLCFVDVTEYSVFLGDVGQHFGLFQSEQIIFTQTLSFVLLTT
jgi:hypothetical protein